ncbi:hypothetical protein GR254_25050, partial [Mycobacterium tuberculosis]|nr:hypothetical protein [Mycobacterium tuberculosis]
MRSRPRLGRHLGYDVAERLLNLNAAGQRPATIRLRKTVLCAAAHASAAISV